MWQALFSSDIGDFAENGFQINRGDYTERVWDMAELFTRKIAKEYRDKIRRLPSDGLQDIGARRKLRMELQARCNLTELEAVNIINGYHVGDYVGIAAIREQERLRKEQEESNES